jgi:hypothetical protein
MSMFSKIVLALEKLAIAFSFVVTSAIVIVLIVFAIEGWRVWQDLPPVEMPSSLGALKEDVACKTISDLHNMIEDLDNAVIKQTIHIQQEIPVVFEVPLDKKTTVELSQDVPLNNRPITMNLPAQGGTVNGQVNMTLPQGYRLPIHLVMTVPISQSLPVEMDVPVEIPLNETDLGPVTGKLKALAHPYTAYLGKALKCSSMPQ